MKLQDFFWNNDNMKVLNMNKKIVALKRNE